MDYDVIYVGDERNAVRVTDHRTPGSRPTGGGWNRPRPAPGPRTVVVPPGARPTVITGGSSSPGYYRPEYMGPAPQDSFASRFGMTMGELIDTGIQVLAAIQPLPGAPTAQGEAGVDVENLILLCRARHNSTYAEHRIMPHALGRFDEVGTHQRGMIRAPSSLRRLAAG